MNYRPYGKNILVEIPEIDKKYFGPNKLIDPATLSDAERAKLGLLSKSAEIANKNSEEQREYKVLAVGNKVDTTEVTVGDLVVFKPAVQAISVDIDGVSYLQAEEFWIAGIMKK